MILIWKTSKEWTVVFLLGFVILPYEKSTMLIEILYCNAALFLLHLLGTRNILYFWGHQDFLFLLRSYLVLRLFSSMESNNNQFFSLYSPQKSAVYIHTLFDIDVFLSTILKSSSLMIRFAHLHFSILLRFYISKLAKYFYSYLFVVHVSHSYIPNHYT